MSDVPAGWHPDPEDPGHLRWWDGTQWTEQRSPIAPATARATAPAAATTTAPASKRSTGKVVLLALGGVVILIIVLVAVGASSDSGGGGGTHISISDYATLSSLGFQANPVLYCGGADTGFDEQRVKSHDANLPDAIRTLFLKYIDDLKKADSDCAANADVGADLQRADRDLGAAVDALNKRCHNGSADPKTFSIPCS